MTFKYRWLNHLDLYCTLTIESILIADIWNYEMHAKLAQFLLHLNVRDGTETKYSLIVFLSILLSARFYTCLRVLIDFSLTVKAATLIFISGRGSAISSPKEGKSGFIYNLVKELISFLGRGNVRAFH